MKMASQRWTQEDFESLAVRLRPYVPSGGLFADLGGGTGDLGSGIARALDARVIIIDPTARVLRRVDAHPLVSLTLASAESLPFPDDYFDALVCSDSFHHTRDQRRAAFEIARVVRPGGGVMMLEYEPTKTLTIFERLLGEPAAFLTMHELRDLMAQSGIEGEAAAQRHGYLFVGRVAAGSSRT